MIRPNLKRRLICASVSKYNIFCCFVFNAFVQIQYGTGSAVGEYYSDQMSFGDATGNHLDVGNVTLGAASRMTFSVSLR